MRRLLAGLRAVSDALGGLWRRNPRLQFALKLLVTAVILFLVARKIDLDALRRLMAAARPAGIVLGLAMIVVSKIVAAERARGLFAAAGAPLAMGVNLRLYWLGMYYNLLLPGGLGGDGYKLLWVRARFDASLKRLAWTLVLDRGSGLAAACLLGALCLTTLDAVPALLRWGPALAAAPAFLLYYLLVRRLLQPFASAWAATQAWSVGVQLAQSAAALALLWALRVELDATAAAAWTALFLGSSIIAMATPFTLGGLGAREAALAWGAALYRLDATQGATMGLLVYVLTALASLPAAYYSWRTEAVGGPPEREEPAEEKA